jgi:hypothetical protein
MMNPSETNPAAVVLQAALFMAVSIFGLSVMIGGVVGSGRVMRGLGNLIVPIFSVVFRGLVILTLLGIAYVLVKQHTGHVAQFFKALSTGSTRQSP